MASFHLLPHSLLLHSHRLNPIQSNFHYSNFPIRNTNPNPPKPKPKASTTTESSELSTPTKPTRRGRKKTSSSSSSSVTSTPKSTRTSRKPKSENGSLSISTTPTEQPQQPPIFVNSEDEEDSYDDGIDFPYDDPPLICCFGAVQKEFLPTVRVHDNQMHPDMYSQWKMLQWDPPEFARAPGGPPSNVAISHVRLGGRAAFMGKVGRDKFGDELVLMMNKERVQTRGVKFDESVRTGCAYMKVKFDSNGRMGMEMVREPAEDSLLRNELNLAVLKEVEFGI